MYIDVHKHKAECDEGHSCLRNLFPHQIAEIQPNRMYSFGLHPWFVKKEKLHDDINIVRSNINNPSIRSVGEIGLDNKVKVDYILQMQAFEQQLEIAESEQIPVIIHCVKAYNDLISIRKRADLKIPWVIHWFNASWQIAEQLLSLNCFLSYGCMLFKEDSKAFKCFTKIPLKHVLFETDDTEYSIQEVYNKASSILNIPLVELQSAIKENFEGCFGDI